MNKLLGKNSFRDLNPDVTREEQGRLLRNDMASNEISYYAHPFLPPFSNFLNGGFGDGIFDTLLLFCGIRVSRSRYTTLKLLSFIWVGLYFSVHFISLLTAISLLRQGSEDRVSELLVALLFPVAFIFQIIMQSRGTYWNIRQQFCKYRPYGEIFVKRAEKIAIFIFTISLFILTGARFTLLSYNTPLSQAWNLIWLWLQLFINNSGFILCYIQLCLICTYIIVMVYDLGGEILNKTGITPKDVLIRHGKLLKLTHDYCRISSIWLPFTVLVWTAELSFFSRAVVDNVPEWLSRSVFLINSILVIGLLVPGALVSSSFDRLKEISVAWMASISAKGHDYDQLIVYLDVADSYFFIAGVYVTGSLVSSLVFFLVNAVGLTYLLTN